MHQAGLGRDWAAAWNSRDLARVLALHAEDCETTSEHIPAPGIDPSGTVRGKGKLRACWATALKEISKLHFELIDTYVSPDSLVVFYQNERGAKICEYLRAQCGRQDHPGLRQSSATGMI